MPIFAVVRMHCCSKYLELSALKKYRHYRPAHEVNALGPLQGELARREVCHQAFMPRARYWEPDNAQRHGVGVQALVPHIVKGGLLIHKMQQARRVPYFLEWLRVMATVTSPSKVSWPGRPRPAAMPFFAWMSFVRNRKYWPFSITCAILL